MIRICDVLKYSEQRAKSFSDLLGDSGVLVEIQTLGDEGLRFLLRGQRKTKTWVALSSYDVDVKDTAGAGDWTTAGLIYQLFSDGRKALVTLTKSNIAEALHYGQALAALNCQFEGARGAMYQIPRQRFLDNLKELTRKNSEKHSFAKSETFEAQRVIPTKVCPSCVGHQTDSMDDLPMSTSVILRKKLSQTH